MAMGRAQLVHGAAGECWLDARAASNPEQAHQRVPACMPCHAGHTLQIKLPKVDLGSLEEVLGRMEVDLTGEWDDVFFVPAGTMSVVAKR